MRILTGLLLLLFLGNSLAHASTAELTWPSRGSKVVCGGRLESGELNLRVSSEDAGLLAADSDDGRVMAFIDLAKPGRMHLIVAEVLTDADYEAREKILARLSPEEAKLLRALSTKHISEFYSGFIDGYALITLYFGDRLVSISCQEQSLSQKTKPGFPIE